MQCATKFGGAERHKMNLNVGRRRFRQDFGEQACMPRTESHRATSEQGKVECRLSLAKQSSHVIIHGQGTVEFQNDASLIMVLQMSADAWQVVQDVDPGSF